MVHDEAFILTILEHPQEEANWLVYADWLEERGDPRAALYRRRRLTSCIGMELVLVPHGSFWMGGEGGKPGDRQIEIPHEFYLGVYPVTQGQWQAVMSSNPSHFSRTGRGNEVVANIADADLKQFPVECVSEYAAEQFIRKLNEREKGPGEWVYRLPTAEEWEYACRGAARSREECAFDFYFDRPTNDLSSTQANFNGNGPAGSAARGPALQRTTRVGSYPPNRLGLWDLHGNVWEWTEAVEGSRQVMQGGSWYLDASFCRAAVRCNAGPSSHEDRYVGFRLALAPGRTDGG
jgi:uncharacterized protein (TIGR02996 family)